MAPRIKITPKEYFFFALTVVAFILVLGKYLFPSIANYLVIRKTDAALSVKIKPAQSCPSDQVTIQLSGGVICRDAVATSSVDLTIFDTSPLDPAGKQQIFPFIKTDVATQTIAIANDYLNNEYYVDRYNPVQITNLTWTEDPYSQEYWRFIFYSMRDEEYLLQAWQETGNAAYKDKFIDILQSFLTTGTNEPLSWEQPHAVAFRTMVLVDAWWELREYNALSMPLNNEILDSLEQHGAYLANPTNFESESNHGVNESSALLLLSTDFPDLPNAASWQTIAEDRLSTEMNTLVDSDGVLVENSPYYHFYTLESFWQVFQWAKSQGIEFSTLTQLKLQKMIQYGTYILQPNDGVPLWGASLDRVIRFSGIEKQIALQNPNFLYVLTQGAQGTQPPQLSVHYDTAGQTIMRSAWSSGNNFVNQTQVIFNVGPFRTNHSQLDALAFTLYSQGLALMPGPGLYTYTSSTYKDYFQGTSSHNTVVVDGQDQNVGAAVAGTFQTGNGYTYQTGESSLYNGVTHDRAVALLGSNLVLVVDHLRSSDEHTYEQMFHLFPGATLAQNGIDITAYNGSPNSNQQVTIHQLLTAGVTVTSTIGQTSPIAGECSGQYEVLTPCYQVQYDQEADNANFVTLLEIGKPNPDLQATISPDGNTVTIADGGTNYTVDIGDIPADMVPVQISNKTQDTLSSAQDTSGSSFTLQNQLDQTSTQATINMPLDLSQKNIGLDFSITNAAQVKNLSMTLISNGGQGYASISLRDVYPDADDGQEIDAIFGKGQLRTSGGEWTIGGTGFDWSNIEAVRFTMTPNLGSVASLNMKSIFLTPAQSQGAIVITFDNGYSSILPAAQIMQDLGFKGNIGVISKNVAGDRAGYLTLSELQDLQSIYGWNMINESWSHSDEVTTYAGNAAGLSQDILAGAQYLDSNGINSDPDWYIYPQGASNPSVQSTVGQYYEFARSTESSPTAYPYGNALAVPTFGYITDTTDPTTVMKAVYDAAKYNQTLFLTFEKIKASPTDPAGYPIANFQEIMDYIAQQQIPVLTYSELDQANGYTVDTMKFADENPEQISLNLGIETSFFSRLLARLPIKL